MATDLKPTGTLIALRTTSCPRAYCDCDSLLPVVFVLKSPYVSMCLVFNALSLARTILQAQHIHLAEPCPHRDPCGGGIDHKTQSQMAVCSGLCCSPVSLLFLLTCAHDPDVGQRAVTSAVTSAMCQSDNEELSEQRVITFRLLKNGVVGKNKASTRRNATPGQVVPAEPCLRPDRLALESTTPELE